MALATSARHQKWLAQLRAGDGNKRLGWKPAKIHRLSARRFLAQLDLNLFISTVHGGLKWLLPASEKPQCASSRASNSQSNGDVWSVRQISKVLQPGQLSVYLPRARMQHRQSGCGKARARSKHDGPDNQANISECSASPILVHFYPEPSYWSVRVPICVCWPLHSSYMLPSWSPCARSGQRHLSPQS